MKDKRSLQFTLPINTEQPDFKEYVKQAWNITFARQKRMSVYSKRIMAMVLAQIKDDHLKLQNFYRIHVSHIVTEADISSKMAYNEVKKAIKELTEVYWLIEEPENHLVPRHLLDTTKTKRRDGYETGYNRGWLTVALNPALEEYFLQLAHYTVYELKHYMHFRSWYSMRMFELLSAFKDTGYWRVGIEEFRGLMDCVNKYPRVPDLLKYTLTEPLEELAATKYAFTYEPIYEANKQGRGRKSIVQVQFTLNSAEPQKIPATWYEYSDAHKKVLVELQKFKVTEKNILRYANSIGIAGAKKLLKEWQEKERSNNRIDDKVKYCNKVWVAEGKKAIKAKTLLG
jgi:plasmid replication initiation protein